MVSYSMKCPCPCPRPRPCPRPCPRPQIRVLPLKEGNNEGNTCVGGKVGGCLSWRREFKGRRAVIGLLCLGGLVPSIGPCGLRGCRIRFVFVLQLCLCCGHLGWCQDW